jgi:hypothetical protein
MRIVTTSLPYDSFVYWTIAEMGDIKRAYDNRSKVVSKNFEFGNSSEAFDKKGFQDVVG